MSGAPEAGGIETGRAATAEPACRVPAAEPAIDLRAVRFAYPGVARFAVDGVTLSIPRGVVVGLVGPNGAGKSTLARLLNGLLRPASGVVRVDGLDAARMPTRRLASHVGFVFQDPSHQLFAPTVADELAFGPRNLGLAPGEVADRVGEAATMLGLGDVLERHPYRIGRARRKLVAIASVLSMRTPIVVLDEPTTGQDHRTTAIVAGVIRTLAERGVTVVCIAHDMALHAGTADRLIVLAGGAVAADGTAREVLADEARLAGVGLAPPQVTRLALRLRAAAGRPPALIPDELVRDLRAGAR